MANTASMMGFSVPDLAGNLNDWGMAMYQNAQAQGAANQANTFSEFMSSTAYQRATQDMEKAGLNPLLAATNGGASTPSAAMAQVPNMMMGAGQSHPSFDPTQMAQKRLIDAQALKTMADTQQSNSATSLNQAMERLRSFEADSQLIGNQGQAAEFNSMQQHPALYDVKATMDSLGGGAGSFMSSLGSASAAALSPLLP